MRDQKTKTLVECALMVALSTILSFITIYKLPQGGDITAVSMMPLVLASFRHGPKWGVFTGFVYGGALRDTGLPAGLLGDGAVLRLWPGAEKAGVERGGRGHGGGAAAVPVQLPFRHHHLAGVRPGDDAGVALLPGV